ncbi:MAG: hypothetical protein BZY79_04730 [SAR202 cluster bacterium Casp-Chloro-G4]|nr:MAG: hypothetical protein BZY79_04730 [SAR202 cluster bacterium Casp-Chloro-G4]
MPSSDRRFANSRASLERASGVDSGVRVAGVGSALAKAVGNTRSDVGIGDGSAVAVGIAVAVNVGTTACWAAADGTTASVAGTAPVPQATSTNAIAERVADVSHPYLRGRKAILAIVELSWLRFRCGPTHGGRTAYVFDVDGRDKVLPSL